MKKWIISTALLCSLASPVFAEGNAAKSEASATASIDITSNRAQLTIMGILAVGIGLLIYIGRREA